MIFFGFFHLNFELKGLKLFKKIVFFLQGLVNLSIFSVWILAIDSFQLLDFISMWVHHAVYLVLVLVSHVASHELILIFALPKHFDFILEQSFVAFTQNFILLLHFHQFFLSGDIQLSNLTIQLRVFVLELIRSLDILAQLLGQLILMLFKFLDIVGHFLGQLFS